MVRSGRGVSSTRHDFQQGAVLGSEDPDGLVVAKDLLVAEDLDVPLGESIHVFGGDGRVINFLGRPWREFQRSCVLQRENVAFMK